jgi:integrase
MYHKSRKFWRVDGKRTINGRAVRRTDPGAVQDKNAQSLGFFVKIKGKEVFLGKTKSKAQAIEAQLKSQKFESKRGVPDYLVYHQKDIEELLNEYFSNTALINQTKKSKTEKHIQRAKLVFSTVIAGTGWVIIKDISSDGLIKVINNKLANDDSKRKSARFGKKTANHWLGFWISFGKWLEKRRYVFKNPLSDIQKFSEEDLEEDRRLVRRRFSDEELLALFQYTPTLKVRLRLTGEDRSMLYKLAAVTGFRAGELAALTPEMFFLDEPVPFVELKGKHAKNGKTVEQVILSHFVWELKDYLHKKAKEKPVWDISSPTHRTKLVRVLRRDFSDIKAKFPEHTTGLFDSNASAQIDFHALRTTFSTMLAETLQSSVLKKLARHSDIRTTEKHYIKHGNAFLQSQLESALGDRMCSNNFTPAERNPRELDEPKIDRAIQLIQKFMKGLSPYEYSVFAKKLRLIVPPNRAAG